jgi:chemotaxis protein methyltransferase WspC
MAMGLLDAGLEPERFSIDAVDISEGALERARTARYSANAFRNADLSFRDRWFRRDGSAAVLDERVRGLVRFTRANILDEAFVAESLASGRGPYDVVFCRNLLIYLTPEARARVAGVLDRLTAAEGLLVVGAAEPPIIRGDWIPAGDHSVFALRRGVHAPRAAGSPRPPARAKPPRPAPPRASRPALAAARPEPASHATLEDVLREAGSLANARRFGAALALCEAHAREAGPAPELFFLMGILHQSAGDADRAEACFHKTLYLDSAHDEALLALALLATQKGDAVMAETYRQSAARILARQARP